MARLFRSMIKLNTHRTYGKMNITFMIARRVLPLVALAFLIFHNGSAPRSFAASYDASGENQRFNFVIFLTDDQRWDTLWAMPILQEKLAARGVTFTNAYTSSPVCCPSRASFLSGGFYSHNTGVLMNNMPNGGVQKFQDEVTLPTLLQKTGYKTMLIGKYLNDYPLIAPYVPPGWTRFLGLISEDSYYAFRFVEGASTEVPGQGQVIKPAQAYITDFEKDAALTFLDENGALPFFLVFSTTAPHDPAVPASGDEELFADYLWRGRAYGEEDLSDKPPFAQRAALHDFSPELVSRYDTFMKKQLRSLQAVDRAVGVIVDKIEAQGKLAQTVFFFTSDNGYLWGEHRRWGKGRPYEESIRVPFVMVMPGISPRADDHLVVPCLDIPATIFEVAGIKTPTDGSSLIPLLQEPSVQWREHFLIQHFREGFGRRYAALRTKSGDKEWKYVEYVTGDKELYDLTNDPYEEENRAQDGSYQWIMDELAAKLEKMKGLVILKHQAPTAVIGQHYAFRLRAWGGRKPYNWSIVDGKLPKGLTLDSKSGLISGIPVRMGRWDVSIKVEDSSVARHTGKHQLFIQQFTLSVGN